MTFLALALVLSPCVAFAGEEVDYNRDIRPILSENCFACHGFDEKTRKAGLRLDVREVALATRKGVTAIKPGDPEGSELWRRVNSTDPEEIMPPPKAHAQLSEAQRQKLKAWIEQGAEYAGHWAFIPPKKATPPSDAVAPIDAFIEKVLRDKGLAPAPEADRSTLIRRLSLDLTGLPPSAEEVTAFMADQDPRAYENLVERLLKSPHYGERLALEWLDAARYADTNGFSIDGGRHMWLWRDYVIHSFNTNKPYDLFLREQIAGDLFPNRTQEQLIASGFQRNAMVTHEGGTIAEENLVNYNADRVKTLGEAVLGLTLGCAQCHDHKFDPLTQKDYYSLFAYFNTLGDAGHGGDGGVNAGPSIEAKTLLRTGEEGALKQRISELEAEMRAPKAKDIAAWKEEQRAILERRGENLKLHPVRLLKISTPNSGGGFSIDQERYALITRPAGFAAFDISMQLPKLAEPITGLRVVMHPDPAKPSGSWGYGEKGSFVVTSISLSAGAVPSDQVNLYRLLEPSRVTANCWDEAARPEGVLNTLKSDGWAPEASHEGPVHLTLTFREALEPTEAAYLTAQVNFGRGANLMAKRMEFFLLTGTDDDSDLPKEIIEILQAATSEADEEAKLVAYFAAHAPAMERTRTELANLRERLSVLSNAFPTMVMAVAEKPRVTHILQRGNYAEPREVVTPSTPAALPPAPEGAPGNRLGLAEWITMPGQPLTARVAVNRFWRMFFGLGIVKSAADFGSQGEWPSHPELLDWLAVDFVENGWDVKRLARQIVLSRAYRRSSVCPSEAWEQDRENRWLARGPRFRLPAEFIRDTALKLSGLLVPRLGGPSVNPYTPGDPWREISHFGSTPATAQSFVQDHGEKLYRRSLYTFWKRTLPPPNMAAFDAPNREVCVVSRPVTNTPLQALVLLNDVQFVEASRAFAQRILAKPGDDEARLRWAFLETTSREPKAEEFRVIKACLARERATFAKSHEAAARLLQAGESPRDESLPLVEHAAWSQVAALLLNLSETITRN